MDYPEPNIIKFDLEGTTNMLKELWEDKRKPSVMVTGKGGYILFENILRKELGIPLLTEEEINNLPEGAYVL